MWRFRLTLLFGVPVWCVDNAFADGVISPTGRAPPKDHAPKDRLLKDHALTFIFYRQIVNVIQDRKKAFPPLI